VEKETLADLANIVQRPEQNYVLSFRGGGGGGGGRKRKKEELVILTKEV
jgi:hypothetical protein